MEERNINQNGVMPIYIEQNDGQIYVGDAYVEEASYAFNEGSYELLGGEYTQVLMQNKVTFTELCQPG